MVRNLVYYSEFRNVKDERFRIEIRREGIYSPSEIALASDPLTIAWDAVDFNENIQGSKATLRLFSQSDREFLNLYTVNPLDVELRVYKYNNILNVFYTYWKGLLDPEIYEEPFTRKKNYAVTLTFSDLSPLSRINFSHTNFVSIDDYIDACKDKLGYNLSIRYLLSTTVDGNPIKNKNFLADNFYTGDNSEPYTMLDVLKEILKPLGAYLTQKDGYLNVWDANQLYNEASKTIEFKGEDATLQANRIYNNVEISYEPNETPELIDLSIDKDFINKLSTVEDKIKETIVFLMPKPTAIIWTSSEKTKENIEIANTASFYSIEEQEDGSIDYGIALYARNKKLINYTLWTTEYEYRSINNVTGHLYDITERSSVFLTIIKTLKTAYISKKPPYINFDPVLGMRILKPIVYDAYLELSLNVLLSVLHNPLGDDEENNRDIDIKTFEAHGKTSTNFLDIPIRMRLKDEDGNVVYHAVENQGWETNDYDLNEWTKVQASSGDTGSILNRFIEAKAKWTPPPVSGWIEIEISDAVRLWGVGLDAFAQSTGMEAAISESKRILSKCNWYLIKGLNVNVIDKFGNTIDAEDVDVNGSLNDEANEKLSISTLLGSCINKSHTAKGAYFDGKEYINSFTREGRTATVEELLIGSVYSKYAVRSMNINCTTKVIESFSPLIVPHFSGIYVRAEELIHVQRNRSELKLTQIKKDIYEPTE